jgi:AbiEi antitoxin C-terminal domain
MQRIFDAAATLPPDGVVGGWAAAYLHGARDLDGKGFQGIGRAPLPLLLPRRLHLADREGVVHWRGPLDTADVVDVRGMRVTSPVRTAFDVARRSRTLEGAIVALDVMGRQVGVTATDVERYGTGHRRARGLPLLRRALPLVDARSRSVGESRLRFLWIVSAGLPRPECNPYLIDKLGQVVGMPDLLLVVAGLVGEYDGAHHRDLRAHTLDNGREEDFEELGLVVVRATSLDLGQRRSVTIRRLDTAYHRALAVAGPSTWGWQPGPAPRAPQRMVS